MESLPATPVPSGPVVRWADPGREQAFGRWLAGVAPRHGLDPATLQPASADASFRRYLRLRTPSGASAQASSFVIMDAPPPLEDVRPFVHVAGLIREAGLRAPRVFECDPAQGFVLLEDLGERLLLPALQTAPPAQADALMRESMAALVKFQCGVPAAQLPEFSRAILHEELELFPQWCVQREHGITWGAAQQEQWAQLCALLVQAAAAQPVVAVHRDWMPRNLMVCEDGPGILDFQDAAAGPVGYDVVSMLRDAFHSWEEEQEIDWAIRYWEGARRAGLPLAADFGEFWRDLEWVGLQRHLRILGVFSRLKHRDGKPAYQEDAPRFLRYCTRVAMRYRELKGLLALLEPISGQRVGSGLTF